MKLLQLKCHSFLCGIGIIGILGTEAFADITITSSTRTSSFDLSSLQPGDTVWIEGHQRNRFIFSNISGTAEAPIVITNLDGEVVLNEPESYGGIQFHNCKHFILRGAPVEGGSDYGIRIVKTGLGAGLQMDQGTTDFEVDRVEITGTSFAGILAKSDELHRPDWTMRNISVHDCYIHDVEGEGIYIGSSFYHDETKSPHEIHGVRIYRNLVENAGWDGIQLGCGTDDVEIYENIIRGYGVVTNDPVQNEGFRLNPGTAGRIYNNYIEGGDGSGSGIFANPHDDMYIYNNVIVTPHEEGIMIGDDAAILPDTTIYIVNNTIVAPSGDGIQFRSLGSKGNVVANNLIVAPGGEHLNRRYFSVSVTESTNLYTATMESAGFVDPENHDYRLLEDSDAVDGGSETGAWGFDFDYDRTTRPEGDQVDIGAFEWHESAISWGFWSPVTSDGWVYTEDFLGWVFVAASPWVYINQFRWVYLPEEMLTESGSWAYFSI